MEGRRQEWKGLRKEDNVKKEARGKVEREQRGKE